MADKNLNIRVRAEGAKRASKELKGVEGSLAKLSKPFDTGPNFDPNSIDFCKPEISPLAAKNTEPAIAAVLPNLDIVLSTPPSSFFARLAPSVRTLIFNFLSAIIFFCLFLHTSVYFFIYN